MWFFFNHTTDLSMYNFNLISTWIHFLCDVGGVNGNSTNINVLSKTKFCRKVGNVTS